MARAVRQDARTTATSPPAGHIEGASGAISASTASRDAVRGTYSDSASRRSRRTCEQAGARPPTAPRSETGARVRVRHVIARGGRAPTLATPSRREGVT